MLIQSLLRKKSLALVSLPETGLLADVINSKDATSTPLVFFFFFQKLSKLLKCIIIITCGLQV